MKSIIRKWLSANLLNVRLVVFFVIVFTWLMYVCLYLLQGDKNTAWWLYVSAFSTGAYFLLQYQEQRRLAHQSPEQAPKFNRSMRRYMKAMERKGIKP